MDNNVKIKWTEALRSGEYRQGTGGLNREDKEFCCLGVLCELAVAEGVTAKSNEEIDDQVFWTYGLVDTAILPPGVVKWAGLAARNPSIKGKSLAERNDGGATFEEIADLIEKHL